MDAAGLLDLGILESCHLVVEQEVLELQLQPQLEQGQEQGLMVLVKLLPLV
jgi:hypothetical protein